jgi:hypothetical protein
MTLDGFRRLALSMPEAIESAHMGHPDFRVGGKIFASLGPAVTTWGGMKLTPEQQEAVMAAEPGVFSPAAGKWGEGGYTIVTLKAAKAKTVRVALTAAWRNVAPAKLVARIDAK